MPARSSLRWTRAHASAADASPVAISRTARRSSSGTTPDSERDFESIISIGRSKQREDASTFGKYGLGFNVSYHFTDTPQFVSSSSVVVFDPHGRAISDGSLGLRADFTGEFGAAQPGLVQPLLRPLAEIEALMLEPADRSLPDQPIRSTLFRFPLRDADAAAQSSLSQRMHSADDVRSLLEELEVGLGEMLLFVQHVQKIALLEVGDDGALRVFASVALDTTPAIADARRSMAAIARPSASVAAPTVPRHSASSCRSRSRLAVRQRGSAGSSSVARARTTTPHSLPLPSAAAFRTPPSPRRCKPPTRYAAVRTASCRCRLRRGCRCM